MKEILKSFDLILDKNIAMSKTLENIYINLIKNTIEDNESRRIIIVTDDFDDSTNWVFKSIYANISSSNVDHNIRVSFVNSQQKEIIVEIEGDYPRYIKISLIQLESILDGCFLGAYVDCVVFDIERKNIKNISEDLTDKIFKPLLLKSNDDINLILMYK